VGPQTEDKKVRISRITIAVLIDFALPQFYSCYPDQTIMIITTDTCLCQYLAKVWRLHYGLGHWSVEFCYRHYKWVLCFALHILGLSCKNNDDCEIHLLAPRWWSMGYPYLLFFLGCEPRYQFGVGVLLKARIRKTPCLPPVRLKPAIND